MQEKLPRRKAASKGINTTQITSNHNCQLSLGIKGQKGSSGLRRREDGRLLGRFVTSDN